MGEDEYLDYRIINYQNHLRNKAGLSVRQYKYNHDYIRKIRVPEQKDALNWTFSFSDYTVADEIPEFGIMLVGPVGCGKTMFAASIINDTIDFRYRNENHILDSYYEWSKYQSSLYELCSGNDLDCLMISVSYLLKSINQMMSTEMYGIDCCIQHIKDVTTLILDDLGAEKSSEWTKSMLFDIIDYRYNNNLPLVVTTNCLPEELKEKIGERSVDRLREMCKLVTINHSSFRKTAE